MGTRTKKINPTIDNHQHGVYEFDFNCGPAVQSCSVIATFSQVYWLYAGAPPPQAIKKKKNDNATCHVFHHMYAKMSLYTGSTVAKMRLAFWLRSPTETFKRHSEK